MEKNMKIVITLILMMTTILVAEPANSNIKNSMIGNYSNISSKQIELSVGDYNQIEI